jgi:hypothetical protein
VLRIPVLPTDLFPVPVSLQSATAFAMLRFPVSVTPEFAAAPSLSRKIPTPDPRTTVLPVIVPDGARRRR